MTVRIEKVEVHCLQDPKAGYYRFEGSYQNVVVLVHGDNGLTGIGESDSPPQVIRSIIEMPTYNQLADGLAKILTGQLLDDPRRLWDEMYARTQWFGRHGAVIHAISALDVAIWDLFARTHGTPLHSMIGTKRHDRLPVYATIYPLAEEIDEITAQVGPLLDAGFLSIKICVDPWWTDTAKVRRNLNHVRKLVGPKRDLMLDVAQEFSRFCEIEGHLPLLEELDFRWIEAPFPLDNMADHARLKAATHIPVGVGDLGLTTCKEYSPFLAADALSFAQPDLTMFGGITEAMRLAVMLEREGCGLIPHGYNTDITIAANLHFMATMRETGMIEYSTSQSCLRTSLVEGLGPIGEDGMIAVPDAPGLGVTLRPDTILRTRVMQ